MTDERVLEVLQGLLARKLVGVEEEEHALKIACLVMDRKIRGDLAPPPAYADQMPERTFQLYCAVVQGLGARGDVADQVLLERALDIVRGAT